MITIDKLSKKSIPDQPEAMKFGSSPKVFLASCVQIKPIDIPKIEN